MFELTAAVEGIAYLDRLATRRDYYDRARRRARATGKTFVVVGAPSGGWTGNYGCGDVCVDLVGCEGCGAPRRDLAVPGCIPVGDGRAVVFVSYVLENMVDIDAGWRECVRAAGSPADVFVASIQPWSTMANVFYPQARWVIDSAPPTGEFRRHPIGNRPADGSLLADARLRSRAVEARKRALDGRTQKFVGTGARRSPLADSRERK